MVELGLGLWGLDHKIASLSNGLSDDGFFESLFFMRA